LRSDKSLNLSVIHRTMETDFKRLQRVLDLKIERCVSYSQLKRILQTIDYKLFNSINESHFGLNVVGESQHWYSVDGKELRGTIDGAMGEKRGLSIVNLTEHKTRRSRIIGHYDALKASEKPIVSAYFEEKEIAQMKLSFDALHTSRENLATIARKKGVYLAQLKGNQGALLEECQLVGEHLAAEFKNTEFSKGHGRVETRQYRGYNFVASEFDQGWKPTNSTTLIVVNRERLHTKTKKITQETCYWLSNQILDKESFSEICKAIRNHWGIETHHNIRDVQMGEDDIKISNQKEALVVASFITLALNLIEKKGSNKSIIRENMTKNWNLVPQIFNQF